MTTGHRLQPSMPVHRHRLESASGLAIEVMDLGATLVRVEVPGPHGPLPLSLALDDLSDHEDPVRNPHLGVTVGRWANRIAGAMITIDDLAHALDANEGDNHLHGGGIGFSRFVWDADTADDRVTFRRTSPDGEMGFPGEVEATTTFTVDDRTIGIRHEAITDRATVVSMTNHTYWNLGGPAETDIRDHVVEVDATTVVPIDDATLPSGPPEPVADTTFDLREPTRLGDRLGFALPNGFDHCFMVDGDGLRRQARVAHPNGVSLEVWSDQPAVQFYTGAFLAGGPGADGRNHDPFAAFCLEPQQVPDAPNLDWAPSAVLRPGERYVHELQFRLDWS